MPIRLIPRGEARAIVLACSACIAGTMSASAADAPAGRATLEPTQQAVPSSTHLQPTVSHRSLNQAVIRMNFVATPWPKVLEQVAEDAGLKLVLIDAPKDRFSRTDWKKYDRSEALRILERELSPLGFKLAVKDDYLTVFSVQRDRTEYQRPVLSQPKSGSQPIQRVSHDDTDATSGVVRTGGPSGPAGRTTSSPANTAAPMRITPQRRAAVEISRDIYSTFESRSSVADQGPNGLPSFTVWRETPARGAVSTERAPLFTVELDTSHNTIVITGEPSVSTGVRDLVRRLDSTSRSEGEVTRLVAGGDNLPAIGRQLEPQLGRLRTRRASDRRLALQSDAPGTPGLPVPGQPVPGQPIIPPPNAISEEDPPARAVVPAPQGGIIGHLRGDVTIQSLNDLNLLILQGNEADVQQVLDVINAVEQAAQGSQPIIQLHTLEHISSEALATMLTDLYQRLTTQTQAAGRAAQTINVIPIVQPNAILVLAPETAMQSILDLILQLDHPSDPADEVEVIRLRNAIASQVVDLLTEFYQNRPGLGTRVRVIADVRTNSLIIQARPRELEEVRLLIGKVDKDKSGATHQSKVVPLTHASAVELAEFLTTSLQSVINPPQQTGQLGAVAGGAGQMAQELRDTKSVVLEFLKTDGSMQQLLKSGLLVDIRFNGEPRTNSLFIMAPKESLPLLEELVRVLDQPSNAMAMLKTYPLRNTDATGAAELLTNLFQPQNDGELGVQLAGAQNASSLVPLRFQADARSNSVIAFGSAESLTMVEAILLKLDSETRRRIEIPVKLRNAPATDVALAINTFLQDRRNLLAAQPELISTYELIDKDVVVTPEPVSNTLLISAAPSYFDTILQIIKDLDNEPPQVAIQALLVEVELNDTDEFGVELGFQDSTLFNRSVGGIPGFLFNNTNQLGNNTAVSPSTIASQGLSNLGLGRGNTDLGFGGLVLSASSESVSILVRALQSRRNARVLSRPLILALDNQTATIRVGQVVPIINGVQINNFGGANPQIIQRETGIILTVRPRISPEGQVVMETHAEKSSLSAQGVPIFVDSGGNVFESPIIDDTTATSTVKVPSGQTVVIGGMITKSDSVTTRKVPWLGDVPVLQHLFRFDSHSERRTELLIFLTPRILHGDADLELVKQVESERLHFFEQEAEEIAGPLYSVPPDASGLPMLPPPEVHDVRPSRSQPGVQPSLPSSAIPAGRL